MQKLIDTIPYWQYEFYDLLYNGWNMVYVKNGDLSKKDITPYTVQNASLICFYNDEGTLGSFEYPAFIRFDNSYGNRQTFICNGRNMNYYAEKAAADINPSFGLTDITVKYKEEFIENFFIYAQEKLLTLPK